MSHTSQKDRKAENFQTKKGHLFPPAGWGAWDGDYDEGTLVAKTKRTVQCRCSRNQDKETECRWMFRPSRGEKRKEFKVPDDVDSMHCETWYILKDDYGEEYWVDDYNIDYYEPYSKW